MLQGDLHSARLCCGLALLYVCVWRHISLIQVKAEHSALRAFDCFVSCLLSAVHWATPSLSANLRYRACILYLVMCSMLKYCLSKTDKSHMKPGVCCFVSFNWYCRIATVQGFPRVACEPRGHEPAIEKRTSSPCPPSDNRVTVAIPALSCFGHVQTKLEVGCEWSGWIKLVWVWLGALLETGV